MFPTLPKEEPSPKMHYIFLQQNKPEIKGDDELLEWFSPIMQLYLLAVVSQADEVRG